MNTFTVIDLREHVGQLMFMVRPPLAAWADSGHFLDQQIRETILYLAGEA